MAMSPFMAAINQLCDEKGLSKEVIIETIEAALAAAYRKDYGTPGKIIKAQLDPESGEAKFWRVYNVVEEVEDQESQKTLKEARMFDKKVEVEGQIEIPLEPHSDFGRIAAQTAKQVITQRIRESERNMLFEEFKDKENKIMNASVQQIEGGNVVVDLGKINGVMLPYDQVKSERYYSGQRLKVFVRAVEETNRGPKIIVSRTDPGLVKGLFENEVPEIAAGTVEIKNIAREAGSRSKVAVYTEQEGLDPLGSCVGQRGSRILAVSAELGDEKIDVILWSEDPNQFIKNALSPAKVAKVKLNEKEKRAEVLVPEDQFSLAIGTGGQNVRLASKLTGWSLDFEKVEDKDIDETDEKEEKVKKVKKVAKKDTKSEAEDQVEGESKVKKSSKKSKDSSKEE